MNLYAMPTLLQINNVKIAVSTGRGEGSIPHFHVFVDREKVNIDGDGNWFEGNKDIVPNKIQKQIEIWVKDRKHKLANLWEHYKNNRVVKTKLLKQYFSTPDSDGSVSITSQSDLSVYGIRKIKVLPDFKMYVLFMDDISGIVDFKDNYFRSLGAESFTDIEEFNDVYFDRDVGYMLEFPDIDITFYELRGWLNI